MESVLGANQIKKDAESLEKWGSDWTNGFQVAPSAIVFPETNEQVQDLVASYRFPYVVKKRFEIPADDGLIWEVDFFEGDNQGLVLAELEVPSADHEFSHPEWLGVDVTDDNRFGNGSLARDPWCDWSEDVLDLMPANQ